MCCSPAEFDHSYKGQEMPKTRYTISKHTMPNSTAVRACMQQTTSYQQIGNQQSWAVNREYGNVKQATITVIENESPTYKLPSVTGMTTYKPQPEASSKVTFLAFGRSSTHKKTTNVHNNMFTIDWQWNQRCDVRVVLCVWESELAAVQPGISWHSTRPWWWTSSASRWSPR